MVKLTTGVTRKCHIEQMRRFQGTIPGTLEPETTLDNTLETSVTAEIVPPPQDTAPESEDTAPESEDTAPESEDTAPESEDTAPVSKTTPESGGSRLPNLVPTQQQEAPRRYPSRVRKPPDYYY